MRKTGFREPVCCLMAEREGFEPSIRNSPYTRFPGVRLKPLGHLSKTFLKFAWLSSRSESRLDLPGVQYWRLLPAHRATGNLVAQGR